MEIDVVHDDITTLQVPAIVNPANTQLSMGGGLAGLIRKKGGEQVYQEAQEQAPVPVGQAVMTGAGDLPADHVIHAPTMDKPASDASTYNTRRAIRAVLTCADQNGVRKVAVPGLGTGVGGVTPDDAAAAMVEEVRQFNATALEQVVLVGYEQELYDAFQSAVTDS